LSKAVAKRAVVNRLTEPPQRVRVSDSPARTCTDVVREADKVRAIWLQQLAPVTKTNLSTTMNGIADG
jgi:hypothetical protein